MGSLIFAGIVAHSQTGVAHDADDLRRDIALEVAKQLEPIKQRLDKQGEDIARLKQNDGIFGQNPIKGASRSGVLNKLTTLDSEKFASFCPH